MAGERKAPRVDPSVYYHAKTRGAADLLKLTTERVVYHLVRMWAAVQDGDGTVIDFSDLDIDGERDALRVFGAVVDYAPPGLFVKVMTSVGFLDFDRRALRVRNWRERQGLSARSRQTGSPGVVLRTTVGSPEESRDSGDTGETGVVVAGTGPVVQECEKGTGDREGVGEKGAHKSKSRNGRKTTGEGPTSSAPFTRFMWWLREGFAYEGYTNNGTDPNLLSKLGQDVDMALVAECFIAIQSGQFGDDFDRRNLSALHAMKKVAAFVGLKIRRQIDGPLFELTAAGRERYPSAVGGRGKVAGADAGKTTRTGGSSYSTEDGPDDAGMDRHPKWADVEARSARPLQDAGR